MPQEVYFKCKLYITGREEMLSIKRKVLLELKWNVLSGHSWGGSPCYSTVDSSVPAT